MPNITVYNLTAAQLVLPSGYCTVTLPAGGSNTFEVPDVDEFRGITTIADLVDAGYISIEASTDSASVRPVPCYTTTELGTTAPATLFPSGTVAYDETRMSPVAAVTDIWRDHTTVVAGTGVQLAALIALGNVPVNAIAFNVDVTAAIPFGTLVRNNGTAFVSCNLSGVISVQAGTPAAGVAGDLTYNTTTQALMVCTASDVPGPIVWDTVFVAPVNAAPATPPPSAATVTGGVYYNTDTSRLSFRVGSNWVDLPVTHYATTAAMEAIRVVAPVNTAGQHGWDSDTNRFSVYPGGALAAWINETTVGMYNTATALPYEGVTVFDPTEFVGGAAGRGQFQVCTVDATPGPAVWNPARVVLPLVDLVGDLPPVGEVPAGYMVLVRGNALVPSSALYAKIGAAWVNVL